MHDQSFADITKILQFLTNSMDFLLIIEQIS